MGRAKDQWIEKTGGFRIGESQNEFLMRVNEIERLEALLVSGTLSMQELELTQRRLCELKGIDFDAD